LEATISSLQVTSVNFSAADSRIRDADVAYETSLFTKNQVLVQSGIAILAQANALPQQALALLR
jgi:flagellin